MQEKKERKGDGNKGKTRLWSDTKWRNWEWIEITREDYDWLIRFGYKNGERIQATRHELGQRNEIRRINERFT